MAYIITISNKIASLRVEETHQIAFAINRDGTPDTTTVPTYTSSAPAVASVSEGGLITALSVGTTIITATAFDDPDTATDTIELTITALEFVASIDTVVASPIKVGATLQLAGSITKNDVEDEVTIPTWSSSDETKATVNASGLVTAIGIGTATITMTATDADENTDTDTIEIEVITNDADSDLFTDDAEVASGTDPEDPTSRPLVFASRFTNLDFSIPIYVELHKSTLVRLVPIPAEATVNYNIDNPRVAVASGNVADGYYVQGNTLGSTNMIISSGPLVKVANIEVYGIKILPLYYLPTRSVIELSLEARSINLDTLEIAPVAGYTFEYDRVNSKIKVTTKNEDVAAESINMVITAETTFDSEVTVELTVGLRVRPYFTPESSSANILADVKAARVFDTEGQIHAEFPGKEIKLVTFTNEIYSFKVFYVRTGSNPYIFEYTPCVLSQDIDRYLLNK